jgi:hypothetical protein
MEFGANMESIGPALRLTVISNFYNNGIMDAYKQQTKQTIINLVIWLSSPSIMSMNERIRMEF